MKALIISNYDPDADEVLFSNERGSWNVSRALRDCRAGKHKTYLIDVAEAYEANKACEVDEVKVRRMLKRPKEFLTEPVLGIIEDGATWFIDGHHRLRALHRAGIKEYAAWIIEEADSAPYIVWYNGKRKAPWEEKKT
jgi:ParB-like nuclease family protein